MTRIIKEKVTVEKLLLDLKQNLNKELSGIARLPEPRADQEYREIIKKIFTLAGSVEPVVMLEMDDGQRRIYTFSMLSQIQKDKDFITSPITVIGRLVITKKDDLEVHSYKPFNLKNGKELFARIEELADDYEESYDKLFLKKSKKTDPYYWLS